MEKYLKINRLNLITSLSNITCILPIYEAYSRNAIYLTIIIINSAFWSFVSHLYENHKHGMGLKIHSKKFSYYTNMLDGISAFILCYWMSCLLFNYCMKTIEEIFEYKDEDIIMIFLYILTDKCLLRIFTTILSFFAFSISQIDESKDTRKIYLIFHSIWHITIFLNLWFWILLLVEQQ